MSSTITQFSLHVANQFIIIFIVVLYAKPLQMHMGNPILYIWVYEPQSAIINLLINPIIGH